MLNKSKLQNAKQKISKMKEKYFNSSNVTKSDDIIDFLPSTVLFDNSKLEKDQANLLNETSSPAHELKSPRVEIKNLLFEDTTENVIGLGKNISPKLLGSNKQYLMDDQDSNRPIFSDHSASQHSHCSKATNKTLKTESIVLSDLSNQFENICFLSSSSDEENTTGRPYLSSMIVPQTSRNVNNLSGLRQTSIQSFDENSEIKQNNEDVQEDSELSEVQSDANSTVFSDTKDSVKMYLHSVKLKPINSENNVFKKKEKETDNDSDNSNNSSYKTISDKKQISIKKSNCEFNSRRKALESQDNNYIGSSEKLQTISLLKEIKASQVSSKPKRKKSTDKNTELNYESNFKSSTMRKRYQNSKKKFNDGEVLYSRYVSDENRLSDHEGDSYLLKKSINKYLKRLNTVSKHSTNLKPSSNRPTLKSCSLIKSDHSNEANRSLSIQRISCAKVDGNFLKLCT